MAGKPQPVAPRFWSKVQKTDGCWFWTGARRNGYGRFGGTKPYRYAHRVAWELTHGPLESPAVKVCHHCDNTLCVRPDHLFIGSQADNVKDRAAKGRTAVLPTEHYKRIGHIGGKARWRRGIEIREV